MLIIVSTYHVVSARNCLHTESTDIPRDPRDPWRQENAPHGNCWICLITLIIMSPANLAYLFSHAKAQRFYIVNRFTEIHRIAICCTLAPCGWRRSVNFVDSVCDIILCHAKVFCVNRLQGLNCFSSWYSWYVERLLTQILKSHK